MNTVDTKIDEPISILDIDIPPERARQVDERAVLELACSIKANGLLQPIGIVRQRDNPQRFRLIYGAHRLAALKMLVNTSSSGVVTAIWDLFKAHAEHGFRLEEKSAENSFILSATSHMAEMAFDKHVEFCDEYVQEVNKGLMVLFEEGKALDIAHSLQQIRKEFVLWETKDVAVVLSRFEQALRELGADQAYLESLPVSEKRTNLVKDTYKRLKDILSLDNLPNEPTPEIAAAYIIDHLQKHLGISDLSDLRKHYLAEAVKTVGTANRPKG
jgi:ParB-like nuclease domain